jgi:hypothetical protein
MLAVGIVSLLTSASFGVITSVNLANYQLDAVYSLPAGPASEASAVTFNPDTGTLFVLGDEGDDLVEVDLQGNEVSNMSLSGFDDTEGLTYIGNGQFVLAEERLQDLYRLTYTPDGSVSRNTLPSVSVGTTIGNQGIEGVSFDPVSSKYYAVKEKDPQAVYELVIDWDTLSINVSSLFTPNLSLLDLSDVQILSTVPSLVGTADQNNLLIYSQESRRLLEVAPDGSILSSFELTGVGDAEGVSIDHDGTIYIVGETPALYVLKPVPEPASVATALLGLLALKPRRNNRRAA